MITCKICHKSYATLNNAHLSTHQISVPEYKKRFRVRYIHSPQAREKIGKSKIGNAYTKGKKIKLTAKTRKKISRWITRFNQSETTRDLRAQQLAGNKLALGYQHTKAFKKRLSKRVRGLWKNQKWRQKVLSSRKLKRFIA